MDLHRQHWPGWEGETEVRQMFGPEEFPPRAASLTRNARERELLLNRARACAEAHRQTSHSANSNASRTN
jgi:hypothetical protein